MSKYISGMALGIIVAAMVTKPVESLAQETYESAQLSTQDLNGTARYIGMGGALEALGADISTITTNPAGIGLFHKSWAGVSAGLTTQSASYSNGGQGDFGSSLNHTGTTNVDFNQIGIVGAGSTKKGAWLRLAINYSKDRNFNQITNAINSLNNASLNKLTYMRLASLKLNSAGQKEWASSINDEYGPKDARWNYMSMQDDLTASAVNDQYSQWYYDQAGKKLYWNDSYCPATAYCGQAKNEGYISNFDFNASATIHDKVFFGLTFGLKDVRYHSTNMYDEMLQDTKHNGGVYGMTDDRRIKGHGYNLKLGVIAMPFNNCGFRIGAYIHTPTWYELTCSGNMSTAASLPCYIEKTTEGEYISPTANGSYDSNQTYGNGYDYSYDYKIITPWKFGVSLGHTIGSVVALGATYEYADYSSIKNEICDGTETGYTTYTDFWGFEHEREYTYNTYAHDNLMDKNTQSVLKAVHTVKFGIEVKPATAFSIRAGYNWVSPMYNSDGSKDYTMYASPEDGSIGAYYSTYDYTNWKDTHRFTLGFGYKISPKMTIDLSYQFSTQKGVYHPFQSLSDIHTYSVNANGSAREFSTSPESNYGTPTTVRNDRHQINCTFGIRF